MNRHKKQIWLAVVLLIILSTSLLFSHFIWQPMKRRFTTSACVGQLREFQVAYYNYASDNNNLAPRSLQDLKKYMTNPKYLPPGVFLCVSSTKKPGDPNKVDDWSSYVLCKPDPIENSNPERAIFSDPNNPIQMLFYCRDHAQQNIAVIAYADLGRDAFELDEVSEERADWFRNLVKNNP